MATTLTYRDILDLPEWRSISGPTAGTTASATNIAGVAMAEDMRCRDYAHPLVLFLNSGVSYSYNTKLDAWGYHSSSGIGGVAAVGSTSVFSPSFGPKGALTGTNTTKKLNLDTMWQAPAAASWTRSGTTITVTTTRNHNLATGQTLYLFATSDATATGAVETYPTQGAKSITVTGATTFTFTGLNAGTTSGTLTIGMGVFTNQLANRGDSKGYIIRVIGNSAGGSGKIEERRIIGNTFGPAPTVYLDKALSFTPQAGDTFEILSGSVLFLNTGTSTVGILKRYDCATHTYANLSITNFIGTVASNTHNQFIALDEQYVPWDRNPGEGYIVDTTTYDTSGDFTKKCLTATATAAGTLTGEASGGDATVLANQFRNYQIRIVEDTTTPTAVGQRRRITSHTAGASPVYTLASNWTVTPSSTCKFVIENDGDRIIGFMGGTTTIYNYYINNLANTAATQNSWDTTSWAARSNAISQGGITWHAFGISPSSSTASENNIKASSIISFRGAGVVTYDILDISGAATGSWTNGCSYGQFGNSSYDLFSSLDYIYLAYNPHTQEGKYAYFFPGASSATGGSTQRSFGRIDSLTGYVEKIAGPKVPTGSTTLLATNQAFISMFQDGDTKIAFYNCVRPYTPTEFLQLMITR